ncbi:bifunctional metallophosphatase/5'-nucleotidase [Actinomadura alba]|uniref:Bifunctional metallophosphatase/5'-nucleotidase n=1 Tax=Actinomadura alba TaxID=406431 RepID=A0ABR7LV05_9ACTN|nr:bifunctional metallophosphatase/5'-nucleotidase [Actinomadura alba]MBC6468682.1 bifunctional metallophosphatase/5'-nucleotidase [Actinomadura alba]
MRHAIRIFRSGPVRHRKRSTSILGIIAGLALSLAATSAAGAATSTATGAVSTAGAPVPVQLMSITDLHGYFGDYTTTVPGARAGEPAQQVGGGAYLTTHLKQLRAGKRNSILFSAGDDFTGWPNETGWFWNEPTIEYLNSIGLDFSTVGNHEMDRGYGFLRHMIDGTCDGRPDDDLCFEDSTGRRFRGADFGYHSGNLVDEHTRKPKLPPYHVEYVDDGRGGRIPVGFVFATTKLLSEEQMSYTPKGFAFLDEADTVNKYAAVLRQQGVRAIVAVVHEGFSQQSGAGYDECVNPFGPAVDFNARITPDVDAIVTGHWHALVNCTLPDPAGNPRPVVEAANHGRLINEINLQLDPKTGEVLRDRTTSVNHANTKDVTPDPETLRIAEYWRKRSVERGNTPVAKVTADLTRAPGDAAESTMYNATADAFRWAANQDGRADLAVAMPGILRNDLRYAANPANPADAPGQVLFSEVALGTVYDSGIGVGLVRGDITGAQLDALLESQWQQAADGSVRYRQMAVSGNVRYTYDPAKPVGHRIDQGDIRIGNRPVRPHATYRIATLANNFFAKNATPGFTALFEATKQDRSLYNGGDALWRYLEKMSPVRPPALGRATPVSGD